MQHWDGSSWSIVVSPNAPIPTGSLGNSLSGVTCTLANDCWATGAHDPGPGFGWQTLIEHWDGNVWSIVASPNTSAVQNNFLNQSTCASATNCWASGTSSNGRVDQTLIAHWDGAAWMLSPSANTSAMQFNILNSVGCASNSDCWAVGYYLNSSNIRQTLIEHYAVPPLLEITAIVRAAGSSSLLTGQAEPLRSIDIEASPDLVEAFTKIGSTTSDATGAFQFEDADAATMWKRFYRAVYP